MSAHDLPGPPGSPRLRRTAAALLGIALLAISAVVALHFWLPAPPTHVTMSTGAPGGAYEVFAERYRQRLAAQGITLELLPSGGSVENLQRLRRGEVDVAIVQSGLPPADGDERLRSLGHLFLEPVWLFTSSARPVVNLRDLAGRRVAVGSPGSGTHTVALAALKLYGLDAPPTQVREIGGEDAAQALRDREVDAAFYVAAPDSPVIASLLRDPSLQLVNVVRAEAWVRRLPYLHRIVLPIGVIDPVADLPPREVTMVATTAVLVADKALHPVIVDLLVDAAKHIHREGNVLNAPGEFPNAREADWPLSPDAQRYYREGPGLLRRWLPLWTAVWVHRLLFVGIPLLALLGPILHFAPIVWRWQMRRRIYRWYGELKMIEHVAREGGGDTPRLLERLDAIDERLKRLRLPNAFTSELYHLRTHVYLVRELLGGSDATAGRPVAAGDLR
jgi:TRAP transporter TAXI family solute receptor